MLDELRIAIAQKACEIEDLVSPAYSISVIARHRTNPRAHLVVSQDTVETIVQAIQQIVDDPRHVIVGGCEILDPSSFRSPNTSS
jgi:hypothetical protein